MNRTDKVKISVIVPTYDNNIFLVNSIKSLKEQNFLNYEIIVVDNACLDSTKLIVEEFIRSIDIGKYSIKYIQEPKIGLHNTRHAGAKAASGDILLYIDEDIVADRNLLKEIFNSYIREDIGCVGGRILPKWEVTPPEWIRLFPRWYLSILNDEDEVKEVKNIYGCNFSIRKKLLFKLGGFNPDGFRDKKMWWMRADGEEGLLIKVRQAGKKVIYNPNCIVWHFIPKERLSIDYFKSRAFKSGVEASFAKFHYNIGSISVPGIIFRSSIFALFYFLHSILAFILFKAGIKHKVMRYYYKARCLYELKLIVNKKLKEIVKRQKWL